MKHIHRLARLGVRLIDTTSGGVSVYPSSESSLVVEVKEGHLLYPVLKELKDSMLVKINESFAFRDDDIIRYQDRLCVPDMDDLVPGLLQRTTIPDIPYIQVSPRCIMILNRFTFGMA